MAFPKSHVPLGSMIWQTSHEPVDYSEAVSAMEAHVAAIQSGQETERVWLLEHPPIYTAGTSTKEQDLLEARFPVFKTGRGGELTYHGPGQRVGYVMMDLAARNKKDLRAFIHCLEEWIIQSLSEFNITAERREGRVGLWVDMARAKGALPGTEAKIAAIGVRVRKWITYHGVSINLNPDLSHFGGIVPCGIREHGVTSFEDLGLTTSMAELDAALRYHGDKILNSFGT